MKNDLLTAFGITLRSIIWPSSVTDKQRELKMLGLPKLSQEHGYVACAPFS